MANQQVEQQAKSERILERVDRGVAAGVPALRTETNRLSLLPTTLNEAMEFAKLVATADIGLRKNFRGNVGACMALCHEAWDAGLPVFQVASKAYVVNDQIAFEAQYIHAKVNMRAPLARRLRTEYIGTGPDRQVVIKGWLKGEEDPFEYTSPKLKDIKTKNSPLWAAEPDQQLHYYGVRAWARRFVPEILLGAYTQEEIESGEGNDAPRVDLTPEQREEARQARPQRHAAADDHVVDADVEDATEFALVDQHGVELSWTDPDEFLSAYDGAMAELHQAGDLKGLLAFWENNSGQLGAVRALGGDQAKWANSIDKTYTRLVSELEHRAAEDRTGTDTAAEAGAVAEQQTAEATAEPPPAAKKSEAPTENANAATPAKAAGRSAATAPAKPQPWLFKPEGGRLKPVECADAADFAKRIRDAISTMGFAPSKIHTFMMMLNKPGMDRLEQVEPELHAGVLEHARSEPHGWGG